MGADNTFGETNFNPDTITLNAKAVMFGITQAARLYKIDEKEYWIPKSVCWFTKAEDQGDPLAGNGDIKGELVIKKWFYDKVINP